MFQENEDKIMEAPRICSDRSRHTFAPFIRVKKPFSHVKLGYWLHILVLVVMLAARASCDETSPTHSPLSIPTRNTETSVYYYVVVNVDTDSPKNESEITAWLSQVFRNRLQNCLPPYHEETTTTPTPPPTTHVTATVSQENTTTSAATTTSFNTTTPATTTTGTPTTTPATTTASTTATTNATTTASTTATTNATTTTGTNTTTPATTTASTTATTPATTTASTTETTPATTTASTTETTPATTTTSTTATTPATTTTSTTATTPATTTTSTTATTPETTTTTTTATTPATTTTTTATTPATTTTTTATTPATTTTTTATTPATTTTGTNTPRPPTTTPGRTRTTRTTRRTRLTRTTRTTRHTRTTPTRPTRPTRPSRPSTPNRPRPVGSNRERRAREIRETSRISSENTTNLFQGIEVSCDRTTAIRNTNCSVTLRLKNRVSSCCILSTLCAASKTSSDIHVVGKTADRINPQQTGCSHNIQELNSCKYTGPAGASCEESGPAYVVPERNSTYCGPDNENNTCSCSVYCSRNDAYYTFQMSIQSSVVNLTYVTSLISKLKNTPNCTADVPCPLSNIASAYTDANVDCSNTEPNLQTCRVILAFRNEVPICNVSAAVNNLFELETDIRYNGQVNRAAICGNTFRGNIRESEFSWVYVDLRPAAFCPAIIESHLLSCPNTTDVLVELEEQCVQQPFIIPDLNVTTAQPNVTLSAESQANALLELTRDVSKLNSSQVAELVSQLESLLAGPTVSLVLGNTSVRIVSNLLGASPEVLSDSSDRIIGIVDTVGLKLVLDGTAETLLSPAVALSVKPADGSNFEETFFSISDPSNVQVRGDPRHRRSLRTDSSIPQGSIRLPPSLTQDLTYEQQQLASRVQFNFYQEDTVYQDRSLGERKLNSGILGASVANLSITKLQDDVVIHLRNTEPVPANFVATCVFWDFTLNDELGGWNPRGCSVRNSTDNETVCGCNHLTSFAILLDLSREPLISRVQATILTFITYIGCGISAIFLSITLLTYLAFGKLRKDIPSKILIQLCLALLLLNFVFLVDAWLALYPDAVGLCISTAWFLHYFLLVSFTWMGIEAFHMYLALVKVFNSHISRYMLKLSLVGWGVPMIVVIIVIAIDKDNYGLVSYGKFPDGTSDDFCWLKNDVAFYVAVVAYFCIIFLFNLAMFVVVLVQVCRIKRQNPQNVQHRSTMQDLRSLAGIMVLLGLTWGFAFFAWGPVNLAFMYLFAIFNSFQGFFIFVFYCAVKENVRKQWRTYLCCGRMRLAENSEWSRTATQKTLKKLSVTRVTSLHSSKSYQSNNSSSSSSFLVNDSPEQSKGIGSPFEDRAITADEDPSVDVVLNEINREYRNQQAP